ncbi:MAG: hypothetical protein R3221_08185 [Spongiibacter sp.]|nr:hypothetical protein [Spongiibacter sp.]
MMHRHLLALPVALVSAMASAAETPRVLEEIIVTAQKRAQSLSDVPVSVTAVSAEKLSEAGIENLADLSEYVPNLKLAEGGWCRIFICAASARAPIRALNYR